MLDIRGMLTALNFEFNLETAVRSVARASKTLKMCLNFENFFSAVVTSTVKINF